jgi:hypothetical protein
VEARSGLVFQSLPTRCLAKPWAVAADVS